MNKERFPRLCDVKKTGMHTGYVFFDGMFVCEDQEDALSYAQKEGYLNLDQAYDDDAYYYTEWDECDDEWYEEHDGVWYACTENTKTKVK